MNDGDEIAAGTDPFNPDSDSDRLNDNQELTGSQNPFLAGVFRPGFDPLVGPPGDPTDPLNRDSDGDLFVDSIEVINGADPNNADSTPDITVVTVPGNRNGLAPRRRFDRSGKRRK